MSGNSGVSYNGGKNITNSPLSSRQRLRWTNDLHERFVDAVSQLGGPDSEFYVLPFFYLTR